MADMATSAKRRRHHAVDPLDAAQSWISLKDWDPGCVCVDPNIPGKGRGVRATEVIQKNTFIMEYKGDLISASEGDEREIVDPSNFRFFFQYKGEYLCIDATNEPLAGDATLGRLANHSSKRPNAKVKAVEVDGTPHLCFFAISEIQVGEEVVYNYGVSNLPFKVVEFEMKIVKHALRKSSQRGVGQVENPEEVPDNGSMVESSLTETHRHHRMEKDMEEEVDHSSDEDYAPGDDEQVSDSDDSVAIGNMDKNLFTDLKGLRKKSKTLG
ncbi:histone-lysine N-methyltransferase SUV39H2-like isoform X2 [Lineus longissimus]|uniref:histone-lysine N-methyltransferase SUV39H2-like isoform X2 n=1 Tax=Lineus longissimus TaxID=88925 RepID=UPI00315CA296